MKTTKLPTNLFYFQRFHGNSKWNRARNPCMFPQHPSNVTLCEWECEYERLVSPLLLLLSQYFRLSSLQFLLLPLPPHWVVAFMFIFQFFFSVLRFFLPWLVFIVCFLISFLKWYFECKTIRTIRCAIAPVDNARWFFQLFYRNFFKL